MHEYWDKQPVPREDTTPGEIEKTRDVSKKTTKLPDGFVWSSCSLKEACEFLNSHYVSDGVFRLCHTVEALKWSMDEYAVIRKKDTNQIIGYITSSNVDTNVDTNMLKMVHISFLCVHPITKSYMWHRHLNTEALIKNKFCQVDRTRKNFYQVRGSCKNVWRRMTSDDIPRVTKILQDYNEKFRIAPVINEEYVKRRVLPIYSFVNDENDDFISFYAAPYERIDGLGTVEQVYRYYVVGDVYDDAFIIAKNFGYHIFNSPEVGMTVESLEKLKFMKGNYVYYYMFNWHLKEMIEPKEINLIIP
jgi:glycylpeptide N-tetradecanoyltransferase